MIDSTAQLPEMPCRELVEAITDYLEGALGERDRLRFEAHLAVCAKCRAYMAQMKATLEIAGRLDADALSTETRAALLDAFRDWRVA